MKNYAIFFLWSSVGSDLGRAGMTFIKGVESMPSHEEFVKATQEHLDGQSGKAFFKGLTGITELSDLELSNW
ncbi:hypothetical protein [Leeuwenhoekiella nanhaiensis]|uniref:Uncharacterized protein n=1 Tax=Leeuwenhoekiella nanhaiensis TaxID=1655491 RepID=A0A2G1VTR9_9FLAO|nr:hypothetical protein [Leeuwenhoekiella nanhaiensis]PHQ30182.1 hypothetical protein CJ305_04255 [Leeuwenhoekiella nanhaiensis]